MPDLPINKQKFGTWPNERFGTFWAACQPFVGTQQSTMDVNWASRLLENTSRVRGIGGQVDLVWNGVFPSGSTLVSLPETYFKFTPIVSAYPLVKDFNVNPLHPEWVGDFITSVKTDYWNMWNVDIVEVYVNGFFVRWNVPSGAGAQAGTLKVYWHAFGV